MSTTGCILYTTLRSDRKIKRLMADSITTRTINYTLLSMVVRNHIRVRTAAWKKISDDKTCIYFALVYDY